MKWIGLTGCMGCGKSTVARILKTDHGLPVLSADEVALSLLKSDADLHDFITNHLGIRAPENQDQSDETNEDFKRYRTEIAAKVFQDPKLLKKYEQYFHPKIKAKVQELKKELSSKTDVAFYDVPLLFEKSMQADFDGIVGVFADTDIQMKRLQARDGWTDEQIKNRIKHQLTNAEKMKQCDFVLTNNMDLEDLKIQVTQLVAKLVSH